MPPAPKAPELRQRRNRAATIATLEAPPARRVPLPKSMTWLPQTKRWWNTIWASPMAGEWVDADVPGLLALAALVDKFWTDPDAKTAAEIRQQQREYGLSPLARRSLQWQIRRVEPQRATTPTIQTPTEPVADPRELLRAVK